MEALLREQALLGEQALNMTNLSEDPCLGKIKLQHLLKQLNDQMSSEESQLLHQMDMLDDYGPHQTQFNQQEQFSLYDCSPNGLWAHSMPPQPQLDFKPKLEGVCSHKQLRRHAYEPKDIHEYTFKPAILQRSARIASNLAPSFQRLTASRSPSPIPYQAKQNRKYSQNRIHQLSQPRGPKIPTNESQPLPSFTPMLTRKSMQQMANCTLNVTARNQMWLAQRNAKIEQLKQEQEQERFRKEAYSFNPAINGPYRRLDGTNLSPFVMDGIAQHFSRNLPKMRPKNTAGNGNNLSSISSMNSLGVASSSVMGGTNSMIGGSTMNGSSKGSLQPSSPLNSGPNSISSSNTNSLTYDQNSMTASAQQKRRRMTTQEGTQLTQTKHQAAQMNVILEDNRFGKAKNNQNNTASKHLIKDNSFHKKVYNHNQTDEDSQSFQCQSKQGTGGKVVNNNRISNENSHPSVVKNAVNGKQMTRRDYEMAIKQLHNKLCRIQL